MVLGRAASHCQGAKVYMTMKIYCREGEKSKMNENKGSEAENKRLGH